MICEAVNHFFPYQSNLVHLKQIIPKLTQSYCLWLHFVTIYRWVRRHQYSGPSVSRSLGTRISHLLDTRRRRHPRLCPCPLIPMASHELINTCLQLSIYVLLNYFHTKDKTGSNLCAMKFWKFENVKLLKEFFDRFGDFNKVVAIS